MPSAPDDIASSSRATPPPAEIISADSPNRRAGLETSRETAGEYVLVECTVQPNGFVAAAHVHPHQSERFEVESGTILRLAVIANAHFEDVRLPFPPAWLQRAGLALGAPLGRALGFAPEYDGTPGQAELAY